MLTLEILVPSVWLMVVALVVAVCSTSAHADDGDQTAPDSVGWTKVGALRVRGGAPESWASGEPDRGRTPEQPVRKLFRA